MTIEKLLKRAGERIQNRRSYVRGEYTARPQTWASAADEDLGVQ